MAAHTQRGSLLDPFTVITGTSMLYIGGSILVLAAAILLITKRRMNAEDGYSSESSPQGKREVTQGDKLT